MEIPYTRNPSYRAVKYTRGTPRNMTGNHLQKASNYTRKPLIYGNPCKVNALFSKGAHPRPSLFEESGVHLKISKTTGKTAETKTTKEVKETNIITIGKTNNSTNQNFQTHVGQSGHGSESFFVLYCLVFSMVFGSFCLDLFGCFGFFGFPYGFWCFETFALYV